MDRPIDSTSEGDPRRFRPLDDLVRALGAVRSSRDHGRLDHIVRRSEGGVREVLDRAQLLPERGLPGDAWERRLPLAPEAQLAVMQTPIAELIAGGQPLSLFGDNLFVDLDLSAASLPIGARIRIGTAMLEVTPKPHNGCKKFRARFGLDALTFVSRPDLRPLNLRGIYLRVIEAGEAACGSAASVIARP